MKITIGSYTKEIDESLLKEGVIDVDFDGALLVQIEINDGLMKITNAMNGYGHNCFDEYKEEIIGIMP